VTGHHLQRHLDRWCSLSIMALVCLFQHFVGVGQHSRGGLHLEESWIGFATQCLQVKHTTAPIVCCLALFALVFVCLRGLSSFLNG
jgi:hypothetical protein